MGWLEEEIENARQIEIAVPVDLSMGDTPKD
jgi:hypothetical protein